MFSCQIKYKLSKKTLVEKLAQRKLQESKGPVYYMYLCLIILVKLEIITQTFNNIRIKKHEAQYFLCFASNYVISKK